MPTTPTGSALQRWLARRIYYGWIIVGITALALIATAGVRAASGVLITPLEDDFQWSRGSISFAISIGLLLYGLAGPLSGALMDRFGPRTVMLGGLALTVASTLTTAAMQALWQFNLVWGLIGGLGTGTAASVLGATVANRWFVHRRGLVTGIFGASASAGQLIFFPLLIWVVAAAGWRASLVMLAIIIGSLLLPVFLLMRDTPADMGLRPLGGTDEPTAKQMAAAGVTATKHPGAMQVMRGAVRVPEFWLLAGSFFVCGATSVGVIGTHLLPHSTDNGINKGTVAIVLAVMGAMNFVGTIASGALTDRFDPRKLLAVYYIFRGLSLLALPLIDSTLGLLVFATFFGLDYIATVPPTVAMSADIFGRRNIGTVYGWIFAAHQLGAAMAAWMGGVARDALGTYTLTFIGAGALAIVGGIMALRIDRDRRVGNADAPLAVPQPQAVPQTSSAGD